MRLLKKAQKKKLAIKCIILLFTLLFAFTSCEVFSFDEDINFGENLRDHLSDELKITYSFYEYPDDAASHIDKIYQIGSYVDHSSFPSYERENYVLAGWQYYKNSKSGSTEAPSNLSFSYRLNSINGSYISGFQVSPSAESFYAVWKKLHTVTFETNSDVVIEPVTVIDGESFSLPQNSEINGNARFRGWYTDPEFSDGSRYQGGPVTSDITLYVKWAEIYTVRFVTNSDIVVEDKTVIDGEYLGLPNIPRKNGNYRFYGWYKDSEFTEPYQNAPVTADMTLYAKWAEVRTIMYYKNDGTDSCSEIDYTFDSTVFFQNAYFGEREGYGFVGWSTSPDESVEYYYGDRLEHFTENLNLYAVWTTDVCTLTYRDVSGTFEDKTLKLGKGAHISVGLVIYENQNWLTNLSSIWKIEAKDLKGFSYSPTTPINNLEFNTYGNHIDANGNFTSYITVTDSCTFYTYFDDVVFHVSFYYYENGGYDSSDFFNRRLFAQVDVAWNQTLTCPDTVPLIPGYTFENWYEQVWNNDEFVLSETPFNFETVFNDDIFHGTRNIILIAKFTEGGPTGGDVTSSISFEETFSDIDVHETINASTITFTAPSGYDSYIWKLNNSVRNDMTGAVAQFDTSSWNTGYHDVELLVIDGSDIYSWAGQIHKQ